MSITTVQQVRCDTQSAEKFCPAGFDFTGSIREAGVEAMSKGWIIKQFASKIEYHCPTHKPKNPEAVNG